jgi:hypothetical protein
LESLEADARDMEDAIYDVDEPLHVKKGSPDSVLAEKVWLTIDESL